MTPLYFTNADITIYRQRRIGSNHRFSISATFTVYPADIQPASPERTQFAGGTVGHIFTGFVNTDCVVKEGDEIRTDGGKVYTVKGVNTWQSAGMLDHKELTLVAKDG